MSRVTRKRLRASRRLSGLPGTLLVLGVTASVALAVLGAASSGNARAAGVASFANATPAPGSTIAAVPVVVSVEVDDIAKVRQDATVTIDAVDQRVEVDYYVGHWAAQGCETVWVVDDWTKVRVATSVLELADGSHDATITVANELGDVSTYSWTFGAAIAPDVVAVTPPNGSLVIDTTPLVSAQVADNDSSLDATLTIDGAQVALDYDPGTRTYSHTPTVPLQDDADHAIVFTVEDPSGNVTVESWSFRVQTTAAATYTGYLPVPATTVTTSQTPIAIRIDGEERIRTSDVVLSLDGSTLPATVTYPIGHWANMGCEVMWVVDDDTVVDVSASSGGLGDGVHSATVSFVDALGLPGAETWLFAVSEPPTISDVWPERGTTDTTPDIGARILDNGPGSLEVTMSIDGTPVGASYDVASGLVSYSVSTPFVDPSDHEVRVEVRDAAGNVVVQVWSFHVQATADTTYCDVLPADGALVAVEDPLIGVTVDDATSLPLDEIVLFVDGAPVDATVSRGVDETQATVRFQPPTLVDGDHTVRVETVNGWDLPSSHEWAFEVEAPPTIGACLPADGSIVETLTPLIQATLADNDGSDVAVSVEVDGDVVHTGVVAPGQWSWRVVEPLADDLTHIVTLTVADAAGNPAESSWSFLVEGIPALPQDVACVECHTTYPVPDHPMDACAGCHTDLDGHGRLLPTTPVKGCSCHGSAEHSADRLIGAYGYTWACEDCHQPLYDWIPTHDDAAVEAQHYTTQDMTTCRPCHVGALTREHNRAPSGGGDPYDCDVCHASEEPAVIAAIAADDTRCSACHPDALHEAVHATAPEAQCVGCHGGDLSTAHVAKLGLDCSVCHDSADPEVQAVITAGDAGCEDCHGTPGGNHGFAAPAVSLDACRICHWQPRHFGDDCSRCHPPFPADAPYYDPDTYTPYGYFQSTASLETEAAELHRIHGNGSWLQGYFTPSGCDSCHRPAACEACHGDVAHGEHTRDPESGTYGHAPVQELVSRGTWTAYKDTARVASTTCVTASCHARALVETEAFATPDCAGCHG